MRRPFSVPLVLLLAVFAAASLLFAGCAEAARVELEPGASSADSSDADALEVVVTHVVDGDTIDVRFADGGEERVRLIGVDTPEATTEIEPYGAEATRYTRASLHRETVYLEIGVERYDPYDRLLAYVWLDPPPADPDEADLREDCFNAHLLLDGYAQLLTIPPNVRYVDEFRAFQTEAREAGAGLWGLEEYGAAADGVGQDSDASGKDSAAEGPGESSGVVSWRDAERYEGDTVTIQGPVVGTYYAQGSGGQPTFINLGVDHPDPDRFTVLIWGEDRSAFPQPPEELYRDKTIRVTGLVELYEGGPQIIVESPDAIEVGE